DRPSAHRAALAQRPPRPQRAAHRRNHSPAGTCQPLHRQRDRKRTVGRRFRARRTDSGQPPVRRRTAGGLPMTKKLVTWSAVVALVLTAGWYALLRPNPVLRISADFVAADGIFPGNRVAILGVPVGTVESVQPRGAFVRVTMTMPPETEIPAGAHAYITSPAVISDRYVEIGPAYQGGEKLTDGAVIPLERSHAPIRWDQLTKSLQTLLDALGPQQADEDLGKLLHTTGTVLDGKGPQIRSAIASLTQASDLVVRNKDDITAVLDNIDQLLRILEQNQRTVEELTTASEQAAAELHGQRQELGEVIDSLSSALVEVNDLV